MDDRKPRVGRFVFWLTLGADGTRVQRAALITEVIEHAEPDTPPTVAMTVFHPWGFTHVKDAQYSEDTKLDHWSY